MKFSHTLSLNANPDWAEHYIDYASLKKVINEVDSSKGQGTTTTSIREDSDTESLLATTLPPLLNPDGQDTFLAKLMENVLHVRDFYYNKLAECNGELIRLQPILEKSASALDFAVLEEQTALLAEQKRGNKTSYSSSNMTPPNSATTTTTTPQLKSLAKFRNENNVEDLRREICDLYIQYHNLQTYASLNCTAVRKILKKFDKSHNTSLKDTETDAFRSLLPFWLGTPEIDDSMDILKQYFAHFFCDDDTEEALRRMKLMIREAITFQRRSVWLDVIQDQRRYESAQMVPGSEKLTRAPSFAADAKAGTPYGAGSLWHLLIEFITSSHKAQMGILSLALFLGLLSWPGIFDDDPIKRNALALFVFVSVLWASEVFPLFVTAMLIPFLSVVLRVIVVDEVRLDAPAASKHVFGSMFSHVIMLLIGGFSIAAALSKHNIAKALASTIAVQCGSGIRTVLLVNMALATVASMWISNVAAPVLCYSLVAPILKATTAETSAAVFGTEQYLSAERDHRLCRALVLGIALASNVGGMASPISSPQNLFAIEYTPIGWLAWFTVSIPLCIALNLLIWVWLVFCFDLPSANSSAVERALQRNRLSSEEPFTPTQNFVVCVSAGVVLLWCFSVNIEDVTGQMGVLGIVPVVIFFGTQILTNEDLNNFLWSVVLLAMGGLVLGDAVESSGLLDVIAHEIAEFIEDRSMSLWEIMSIFTLLILICTTFVSHTVGAIVVLPILQSIGSHMSPVSHDRELVFAGALACSAAMGLPVSGFPNMTAACQEDHLGKRILSTIDFLKYAVPASLMSWAVIVTFGYSLILFAVPSND